MSPIVTWPLVGSSNPAIIDSVTVLPAPFGPSKSDDFTRLNGQVDAVDDPTARSLPAKFVRA